MDAQGLLALAAVRKRCSTGEARRIRTTARLTMQEVAEHCEVDQATVSRWERSVSVPRGPAALLYAELLDRLTAVESPEPAASA